ncbi:OpgC family protein [Roseovarius aestuariivivens]|uniref:OpgC family protein n=1 Tax=Roseovarius aestuariivivens TaxID=1888910 RepID=UPI001080EAE7|nr:OpgC domain-containing protein [Roseovarius aestuariivivens]
MATISPSSDYRQERAAPARADAVASTRDPRLDFFRGIAMFIILVAHIPDNPWTGWIPARFGFSDATEIFVFCSGMASAIAFGGTFARKGFWMGTARVGYRTWQVYWAHIGLFFFVAMSMAALDASGAFEKSYVDSLNLRWFFEDPQSQIVGAFTLTYVPNYFDILPMYLVVLAMMPLIVAASRVHLWAVAGLSVGVWLAAQAQLLWLPAEPWSDREWFFNPFGWQLLFFTGFAFMIGWLPAPPVSRRLIWLAVAFVVLTAPIGSWKVFVWVEAALPSLGEAIRGIWKVFHTVEDEIGFNIRGKTDFGLLRYLHFLSLAYLCWVAVGRDGWRLRQVAAGDAGRATQSILAMITKVGQQSLVIFVFSMALARLLGVFLDVSGRSFATVTLVNLIGFALIIGVAYGAAWVKSQPWRSKRT